MLEKLKYFKIIIFLEALFYILLSIILVRLFKIKFYSKFIGDYMIKTNLDNNKNFSDILNIHENVKNIFPIKITCLESSLSLKKSLNNRRINSILYLGIRKNNNIMQAHAWIETNNNQKNDNYKVVSFFS